MRRWPAIVKPGKVCRSTKNAPFEEGAQLGPFFMPFIPLEQQFAPDLLVFLPNLTELANFTYVSGEENISVVKEMRRKTVC
jgi:hypothetical protein